MKNKTKGLIALIAMTAAAAAAAGSSTFAWFQTNRSAELSFTKITIAKRGANELKAELLNLGLETLSDDKQSLTVATPANAEASDISSKDGVQLYAPVWGKKVGDAEKVSKVDTVIDEANSHANVWFTEFGFKLTNEKKGSDTTKLNVFFDNKTLLKAVEVDAENMDTYRSQVAAYEGNTETHGGITLEQYNTAKPKVVQQDKNDAAAKWSRVAIIALDDAPANHAAVGSSSTLNPTAVLTFENAATGEGDATNEYINSTTLTNNLMDIKTYAAADRHYTTAFADPENYYADTHVAYSSMTSDDAKKGYLVTLDPDDPDINTDDANTKHYLVRVWLEGTENDDQEAADGGEIALNLGFSSYGIDA